MHTEKRRVVLDTNIIISAAISKNGNPAKVLKSLVKGDFLNFTSKEIVEEINNVFEKDRIKRIATRKNLVLSGFLLSSVLIEPSFDEKVVIDSDDDKFINCALTANADVVSGDSHLLTLKKFGNVKIISPKEFLDSL
ncbi:MAG TPA: putative toxin-antitoxin system toxin component, PIN family [Candidatus Nanoarchaeia archaeon]|nr:putative toxin-antitoxin system toxin component, PIN family [Candidatus Nanoarchaeia archaeon]